MGGYGQQGFGGQMKDLGSTRRVLNYVHLPYSVMRRLWGQRRRKQ